MHSIFRHYTTLFAARALSLGASCEIWKMQMAKLTQITYELDIKYQQSHELLVRL